MSFYQKLTERIAWDKTVSEQADALKLFDDISESEICELMQYVKRYEAGILVEYLGIEKLRSHIPDLLEWLQDINWPASRGAINLLKNAPHEALSEVKRILSEELHDSVWIYNILVQLVNKWKTEQIEQLKPLLLLVIEKADKEGAAIEALRILQMNRLLTKSELQYYFQFLKQQYTGYEVWIKELMNEVNMNEVNMNEDKL